MNISIYSFLLPSIAGLSTLLGTFLLFINFRNKDKVILRTLSFAAGVMITISIIELIPESYKLLTNYLFKFPSIIVLLLFFCIGNIITLYLDSKLRGKGKNSLYSAGIISMLAIAAHNLPEGMISFAATTTDLKLGIQLTLAILLHNIPEGLTISIPIYYATHKKRRAVAYTLISAISEPLGAILAFILFKNHINNFILGIVYSVIAGIMINISLYELLPESFLFKKRKSTLFFLFIGIISTIMIHIMLK